jgi:hypothetical protein
MGATLGSLFGEKVDEALLPLVGLPSHKLLVSPCATIGCSSIEGVTVSRGLYEEAFCSESHIESTHCAISLRRF